MGNREAPARAGHHRHAALAQTVIRNCAAALLVLVMASPARAQNVEGYLALARAYAAGRGDTSAQQLATWSEADITAAASAAAITASARDLLAAAILHTDLANTIIDAQPQLATFHLNKARGALTVASERIGQRERLEPIVRRWFRFVASIYTSCELLPQASEHVHVGLLRFPADPGLYVARGVIIEVRLRRTLVPDWRRGVPINGGAHSAVEDRLQGAAANHLHALSLDAHDAEAHLHLGWVRLFLEDKRAKADLEAALADATDDTIRYLAHLFLGGLAEREQRLAEARREYEEARAVGPGFQTPYVALSRIEAALGREDLAREHALVGVQLTRTDDDPWWDFRIGFDRESLRWLRAEARKP
jgi:tetratricopeptide (TPR) repeat protein